jgi:hypothetical protein
MTNFVLENAGNLIVMAFAIGMGIVIAYVLNDLGK